MCGRRVRTGGADVRVVTVHVPEPLRELTAGRSELRIEAGDVGEVLARLRADEPLLARRLFRDDGELRGHVNLFVNGRDVRRLEAADRGLSEDAELFIVPSVAGG